MKHFQRSLWAFGCLVLGAAHAQQGGELTGRVTDGAGSTPFGGARVVIPELGRELFTARDGRYRFTDLPAGDYTLRVEYLGADAVESRLTLSSAGAEQDVRIGIDGVRLDNVLVVGQAAGQAAALNQQRAADNIKTIVAADAIGQFPDQNAAEALQRLPGVSVARDQGEGRFVIIRGIDPSLTTTTINGIRVPGPEADSRQVNLDVISSDLLESLEVSKSQTADMDGDSVGGNVEIKSATALTRGNSLNARVEGSYNEQVKETSPKLSLSGTRLFDLAGANNFGVAAAVSYFSRDFGSDNVETAGWPELEGPDGDVRGLEEAEQRDYTINRERLSAALNFDWRVNRNLDLYWRSLYSDYSDDEVQQTNVYKFDAGDLVALDADSASVEEGEVEKLTEFRKETQRIVSTVLGAEQRAGAYTFNYTAGFSRASEDTPNALGATFVGEELDIGYNAKDRMIPRLSSTSAAYADPETFELDELVLDSTSTAERETTLAFDAKRALRFGESQGYVKGGVKARLRNKNGNVDVQSYDGFPDDFTIADFAPQTVDYPLGTWGPAASRAGVSRFFANNRADLELDGDSSDFDSAIEDFEISEDIYAGYGMAGITLGKLRLNGGLRYEQAETDSRGTQIVIDEENGDGDPTFTTLTQSRSDEQLLPSFNLRYEMDTRSIFRAGYSQTIARPGFEASAPRQAIEVTEDDGEFERVAELGNPDLKPLKSQNFDLGMEFYPKGLGVFSVGVFLKKLDRFFVVSDIAGQPGAFEDFDEAITTLNGGAARVYGLEMNFTRKLKTLAAPFDGLLLGANLTLSQSDATLPFRTAKSTLPRQSNRIGNLMLGYEKYGASLRVSATYRSQYLDEIGELDDPTTDRYVDEHLQIDVTGGYRFLRRYEAYFSLVNLNNEPFYAYFDSPRFASQYEEYGPTYEFGIKASF